MPRRFASVVALVAVTLVAAARDACALGAASADGATRTHDERALLIWDPSAKAELLVVAASLDAPPGVAAVLVPTPTPPLAAPVVSGDPSRAIDSLDAGRRAALVAAPFDATDAPPLAVLPAADAPAIGSWLRRRSVAVPAELSRWVAPYTERAFHMTIVAAREPPPTGAPTPTHATPWVRLGFLSPAPFFPSSEPAAGRVDRATPPRTRQLVTLAPARLAARVGAAPFASTRERALDADQLHDAFGAELAAELGLPALGPRVVVQTYELDDAAAGEDLWFSDAEPEPPPSDVRESPRPSTRSGRVAAVLGVAAATALALVVARARRRRVPR